MRLPAAVTRAVDTYTDRHLGLEVGAYDRRREHQHPTPPERQRDAAQHGHSHSYGWSEDKARQAQTADGADFGAMVREAGFTLD